MDAVADEHSWLFDLIDPDPDRRAAAIDRQTAPKYQRVADDIREKIRTGELKPGDKLPSTAELIAEYGVSYGSNPGRNACSASGEPGRG